MTKRHDLNGLRIQVPGHAEIYLVVDGQRRHIPDPQTYNNLFRDWNGVIQDPHSASIEVGPALSSGATLSQVQGHDEVYLVSNGLKRHIPSPAAMERYHFDWKHIKHVSHALIAGLPQGAPLPMP